MIDTILAENSTSSQQSKSKKAGRGIPDKYKDVRAEMNIEKLAIWSAKPTRTTVFNPSKIIELTPEKLPNDQIVARKVKIVPSAEYGYPTTQTQEYWYALQKIWHDSSDKITGRIEFTRRQIIEEILGKKYGRNTRRALDLSLNQLGTTRFEFDYVFYDKEKGETHREVRKFHLITEEGLTEKKAPEQIVHDKCFVTLHPLIVSNLRSGYFKPVLLSVVTQIKSDIARLLYRKLDTQFSNYTKYEISSERFFREHGIEGKKYKTPSGRKQNLDKAIDELTGMPTSSGAIIDRYEFRRTADGKDWKLIVRSKKGKCLLGKKHSKPSQDDIEDSYYPQVKPETRRNLEQQSFDFEESLKDNKKEPQKEVKPIIESNSYKPSLGSEVEQVLEHFRAVYFEGNTDFEFNNKDASKASALIEKYGVEKAKAIITQAKTLTDKDNFRLRTLTGLGKYINDALKLAEKDVRQAKIDRRNADNLLKQRRENQRIDHQKLYAEQYYQYVEDVLNVLVIRLPKEYQAFEDQEAQQKEHLEADIGSASAPMKKIKQTQLVFFNRPREKARRAVTFFQDKKISIPDFWQWDTDTNPENLEFRVESDLV